MFVVFKFTGHCEVEVSLKFGQSAEIPLSIADTTSKGGGFDGPFASFSLGTGKTSPKVTWMTNH